MDRGRDGWTEGGTDGQREAGREAGRGKDVRRAGSRGAVSEVCTYAVHVLLDLPWHVKIDHLSYLEMRINLDEYLTWIH